MAADAESLADEESCEALQRRIRILEAKLARSEHNRELLEQVQESSESIVQSALAQMAEAQQVLTHKNDELEAIHEQLRASQEAAESANKAKSQFLASMSHELRTPLNAIIGYAELLEEELDFGDISPEEMTVDLGRIQTAARHLLTLVNDILDLSKIEAGAYTLDLQRIDAGEVLRAAVINAQLGITKNGNRLEIEMETMDTIVTDPRVISQSAINLLSNAGKFTQNGVVRLVLKREGNGIRFCVEDSGIGMTDRQKDAVFDSFVQADVSTTRKYGGTGLGLSISRKLVEMVGGTIRVDSTLDVGSTFEVWLPDLEREDAVVSESELAATAS